MKIRRVGAELLHADRQKDMTKLTVVFRKFALISDYEQGMIFILHGHGRIEVITPYLPAETRKKHESHLL